MEALNAEDLYSDNCSYPAKKPYSDKEPFPDTETQKKAERIAKAARKSISRYCYEECASYCCRKGYLILTEKQAGLVLQGKKSEYLKNKNIKLLDDGRYSLNMGKLNMPCPSLKDFKCTIHSKRNRSKACREFPLFFKDSFVLLSSRCPAVRAGMLYLYTHKLVKLGYKIYRENFEIEL